MRKWGALAIGGVLLITLATPVNAAAPKAGAPCSKKNSTATSAGKKYTCILSGKKLVWDKGVAIPKPNSDVDTSKQADPKNLLANDSRITPFIKLTNLDICKTEDVTPEVLVDGTIAHHNGFPRPVQSFRGMKSAKVLVIPLSFNDLPFSDVKVQRGPVMTSDVDLISEAITGVIARYKKLSNQKFDLKIDVLPKSKWWVIDSNNPFSGTWGVNNFPKLHEIIDKYQRDFNFDEYDSYAFITGNGTLKLGDPTSAQATFAEKVTNSKSGYISALLMFGSIESQSIWVHELGHSLFSLEDLYLFSQAASGDPRIKGLDLTVPVKWDLMAEAPRDDLLQWNRFLIGWLSDSEIRCINEQSSSIHYLTDNLQSTSPKLLTINLAPGVTLAAEARSYTQKSKGLLLYTINTYVAHGQGPILSQNTLVLKGGSKSWNGWKFQVLESDENGLQVEVTKTDIDKFVPPATKPAINPPGVPTSAIKVTRGDIISTGCLKGRATWDVQGHQSYRSYITSSEDFQKVYFETGYVNDSRNPLVIEISGLPCNVGLRMMTEFYSEKDGKGERLVIENRQLSNLSCEDTTKKP